MDQFVCVVTGRNFIRQVEGVGEAMGFKTQVSVKAANEKEAIDKTEIMFQRIAKSKKWEHPKQIDQGFRAEINVAIKKNEATTPSLPAGTDIKWIRMNGLK